MKKLIEALHVKSSRAEARAKAYDEAHGAKPEDSHGYHSGWLAGYWAGAAATYKSTLDMLDKDGGNDA